MLFSYDEGTARAIERLLVAIDACCYQDNKRHMIAAYGSLPNISNLRDAGYPFSDSQTARVAIFLFAVQQLHRRTIQFQARNLDGERSGEGWRGIVYSMLILLELGISDGLHETPNGFQAYLKRLRLRLFPDQVAINCHGWPRASRAN
jgi:hypothetical protein